MRAHHDESNREISLRLALNYLDQGITVINKSLQLIAWNDRFVELLDFPEDLITDGISLEALFRFNSKRGEYGDGDVETLVGDRLELAARFQSHCFDRVRPNGTVIEVKGNPIDNGNGFVTVYTDVTIERQKQAVLKKTIARRSTALQREAEAHQNAIAVLEESQNCIRKITDSSEFDNREAGKDLAKILAQSEALIHQADATNSRPTRYKFGSWQLDIKNRVLLDDANPVSLSPTEFDLLSVMVRNSRQVLSRDQLLKQARGRVPGPHDRSVDVHVAKLRKILNRSDCDSPVILTVRNSGYMLARDVSIS